MYKILGAVLTDAIKFHVHKYTNHEPWFFRLHKFVRLFVFITSIQGRLSQRIGIETETHSILMVSISNALK